MYYHMVTIIMLIWEFNINHDKIYWTQKLKEYKYLKFEIFIF